MRYFVTVEGREYQVDLGPDGPRVDGTPVEVDLAHVDGTDVRSLLVDGASHRLLARREGDGAWHLGLGAQAYRAEAVDERTRTIREMTGTVGGPTGPRPILAPMPGMVVKVEVCEGDLVEPGQGVVIVEAMKMENELTAQAAGIVTRIHVSEGQTVEKDQVLVELGSPDAEGGDGT